MTSFAEYKKRRGEKNKFVIKTSHKASKTVEDILFSIGS